MMPYNTCRNIFHKCEEILCFLQCNCCEGRGVIFHVECNQKLECNIYAITN